MTNPLRTAAEYIETLTREELEEYFALDAYDGIAAQSAYWAAAKANWNHAEGMAAAYGALCEVEAS